MASIYNFGGGGFGLVGAAAGTGGPLGILGGGAPGGGAPGAGTSTASLTNGPHIGQGPFGLVPGNVNVPPNLYQGIQSVYPGIDGLTSNTGNVIKHEVAGELSPETINSIQDQAARFGVTNGMPLSGLQGHQGLRSLGLNVEAQQSKGVGDYGAFTGNLGKLVTDPNLAAELATWNATNQAAPDPQQAFQEMQRQYQMAMNQAASRGAINPRGPAGGTGMMPGQGLAYNGPAGGTLPSQMPTGIPGAGAPGAYPGPDSFQPNPNYNPSQFYPGTDLPGSTSLDYLLGQQDPIWGEGQGGAANGGLPLAGGQNLSNSPWMNPENNPWDQWDPNSLLGNYFGS